MPYPFVECRWYTSTTGRRIDLVVLHTAETPEGANTARAVADYFANTDNRVSAHYCVDSDEIVQSCREVHVAYAAPGANANGVHVELSGRASQSAADWHDAYSIAQFATAAPLVADICARHRIPVRYVNASALRAGGSGARGITTHADVSKAFRRSTHTDPGPNFPIVEFVNRVLGATPPERSNVIVHNYVASLVAPNGGTWHLAADGGIFTDTDGLNGPMAPFYGSVPGVGGAGPDVRVKGILPHGQGYKVVVQHLKDESISYFHFPAT